MAQELLAAGLPRSELYPPSEEYDRARWRQLLRRLSRLPRAIVLDLYLRVSNPWLSEDEAAAIIGRDACLRFLRRNTHVWLVVNSDMSPQRLILAEAAAVAGAPSIWWQDDFHHSPPRIAFSAAALLNEAGESAVVSNAAGVQLFYRPATQPQQARPIPPVPRVGVAVNAFFTAAPQELALLERIKQTLGATTLLLRLHPRAPAGLARSLPDWLEVHNATESVDSYGRRVDVVLVGNSAVQLRLLASGTPVIHVSGLDPHEFDLNGYVRRGVVFGAHPLGAQTLDEARRFHEDGVYFDGLQRQLRRADEESGRSLEELVELIRSGRNRPPRTGTSL